MIKALATVLPRACHAPPHLTTCTSSGCGRHRGLAKAVLRRPSLPWQEYFLGPVSRDRHFHRNARWSTGMPSSYRPRSTHNRKVVTEIKQGTQIVTACSSMPQTHTTSLLIAMKQVDFLLIHSHPSQLTVSKRLILIVLPIQKVCPILLTGPTT